MNDPSKDAARFDNLFVAKGQTIALAVKISMCLHNRSGLFLLQFGVNSRHVSALFASGVLCIQTLFLWPMMQAT